MLEKRYRLQVESDGKPVEIHHNDETFTAQEIGRIRLVRVSDSLSTANRVEIATTLNKVMNLEGYAAMVVPESMPFEFYALELPQEPELQTIKYEDMSPEKRAELQKWWQEFMSGTPGVLAEVKFVPSQTYATGGVVKGPILADLDCGCVVHPMKSKGDALK